MRCNARCVHCGSAAGIDRKDNLSDDEILRVCDQLAEIKCQKVTLIGGEMFLHPAWRKIVKKLSAYGINVAVVTNGLLLNDDNVKFLADNKVSVIGISLDGPNAGIHDGIRNVSGLFKKIMALEECIRQNNIPTVAITTVTNLNIDYLAEFRNMLLSSYFNGWQIQVGAPFGRMKQDISLNEFEYYLLGIFLSSTQKLIPQRQLDILGMHCIGYYSKLIPNTVSNYQTNWKGCPGGKYVMGIRSNGKVVGCLSIYNDDFIEGDLREKPLSEIWREKAFCQWNRRIIRYKNLKGFCKECSFGIACCAGCSGMAQAYANDVGEARFCFHKTESKYENYIGNDPYSLLMRKLVNGKITDAGQLLLEGAQPLTDNFINGLNLSDRQKKQLKMLIPKVDC